MVIASTLLSKSYSSFFAAAFTTHASFSKDLIQQYDAFILDQFGVLHNGVTALDGAVACLESLHQAGKKLVILSNTSAPSAAALQKLPKFGFTPHHFVGAVTSGEEAARYIRQHLTGKKALFFTWDALTDPQNNPRLTALPEQFLKQCSSNTEQLQIASSPADADFVLFHGSEVILTDHNHQVPLGDFITTGNMENDDVIDPLLQQCLTRQLPAVCANPDFVVQTPTGDVAYMPGRLAARYQQLGGTCTVFGKPHVEHFQACLDKLGLPADRVAHVGDSLHHDIAGATAAGIPTVFVTSGIHATELQTTSFGEMPTKDALEDVLREYQTTPTHVVPAFRL